MALLDLISLDRGYPGGAGHLALAGGGKAAAWPHERAGLGPFPGYLLRNRVAAGDRVRDRSLGVGHGLLPPLEGLNYLVRPLEPPLRPDLVIDAIGSQRRFDTLPVSGVERLNVLASHSDRVLLGPHALLSKEKTIDRLSISTAPARRSQVEWRVG